MTEGWTGSLVELGVDGNLKVIAVEVGRLVQDRQHVLDHKRQGLIGGNERRARIGGEASLTGNMSCWFP